MHSNSRLWTKFWQLSNWWNKCRDNEADEDNKDANHQLMQKTLQIAMH